MNQLSNRLSPPPPSPLPLILLPLCYDSFLPSSALHLTFTVGNTNIELYSSFQRSYHKFVCLGNCFIITDSLITQTSSLSLIFPINVVILQIIQEKDLKDESYFYLHFKAAFFKHTKYSTCDQL